MLVTWRLEAGGPQVCPDSFFWAPSRCCRSAVRLAARVVWLCSTQEAASSSLAIGNFSMLLTRRIVKWPERVCINKHSSVPSVFFRVLDLMSAAEISIILSRQLINQLVNKLLLKWEKRFPLIHNPTNVISCLGLIVPTPTRESPEAHSGNLLCTLSVSKHSLSASIGGFFFEIYFW